MSSFVDSDQTSVNFPSNWQSERNISSNSSQTNPLKFEDVECQSFDRTSIAIQANLSETVEYVQNPDIPKVVDFLRRMEPIVIKVIEQNNRSKAFIHYQKLMAAHEDESITNTHSLKQTDLGDDVQVLCLDWNSTGTTVAVGCGLSQHQDWCTHKGIVCTWNIDRRTLDAAKADFKLDVDSCASSLKFHPRQPGILAVGSFTGEVTVFNLTLPEGNMVLAYSKASDCSHKDPVTCVQWISKGNDMSLVSAGYDGKILLWTIPSRGQQLEITNAFAVTVRSLPRALRGKVTNLEKEAGMTGVAFSRKESDLFLSIGETGAILHCNLNTKDPIGSLGDISLYNPVVLSLRPQQGPVYSVNESPFHRNLFLTCSADGSIKIYSILKIDPVFSCDLAAGYLYSAAWSPTRPTVFAVASSSGIVALFDLTANETGPVAKMEATNDSKSVHCVVFNPQKADVLATGDETGVVKVWKLGERFMSQNIGEEEKLNQLAMGSTED